LLRRAYCKSKCFTNSRHLELLFVEKLAFFIALKSALKQLSKKFTIIGDVRGQGLFLGIELVDQHVHPLAEKTEYLINRRREFGILMSSDGTDHKIIKIKPPLTFTIENAREVIFYLQKVLAEDFMKII
jgi:4-aminobutyrate aminotransferase-like enzyme